MVINGFKIPKDTQIMANFWAIDNDPNLWENPNDFIPERFLSADGKTFSKPEYLIPFSYGLYLNRLCTWSYLLKICEYLLGKRSCPGEGLGIVEVFLYISSLLQKYDIKATDNTDHKLEYEFQFSITPKHNPVYCFAKRRYN